MLLIKKHIIIYVLCLCTVWAQAQEYKGTNWGFSVGAVTAIGNRFQRVGFSLQGYYLYNHIQANAEIRAYHNFKNLGPTLGYNELVTSLGLLAGYGKQHNVYNPFLSTVANQTNFTNSVGYAYNLYFNKVKTTQQTGTIAFQVGSVSIISENDIFARPTLDRFRTGAFLVQYQYKNLYQFAANCTMWTGQMGNKVTTDSNFLFAGYMDTTKGVYTSYSNGLLSGQLKMAPWRRQTLQANLGIDAEQVRNFVQNRLIHDMAFIPRRWVKPKSCHMPMLDTAGNQYLYKPTQKIKAVTPYWNLFTGAACFY